MERKTALAAIGAVTLTLVTGAIAAGANFGLLGFGSGSQPVGHLRPVTETSTTAGDSSSPDIVTVYADSPSGAPGVEASVQSTDDSTDDLTPDVQSSDDSIDDISDDSSVDDSSVDDSPDVVDDSHESDSSHEDSEPDDD